MKISGINLSIVGVQFCGIKKPYINNNGNKIIPIAINPGEEEIEQAFDTVQTTRPFGEGVNGKVYHFGEDLVVKQHKGSKAYNPMPYREINMLDKMYDAKVDLPNSQKGIFAIENPETTLIVSTKVNGEMINPQTNPFNSAKFESLLDTIFMIDSGYELQGSAKPAVISERSRYLNYDFNLGNLRFDDTQVGLFDFENSTFENIDTMIRERIINKAYNMNPHRSDTSQLPSNVRSFEFFGLRNYLTEVSNPIEVLSDYLVEKGKYHKKMAKFYEDFANESAYKEIVLDISKKENAHSELLKPDENHKIPTDILRSEAIKIQMSRFLHLKSSHVRKGKINPKQLQDFTNTSIDFFNSQLENAIKHHDRNRIIYYQNAISLMDDWKAVNQEIKARIESGDEKIISKLTDEHIETLEELINRKSIPPVLAQKLPDNFIQITQTQNPLGTGANSKVYVINDDYVLKILNKDDPNRLEIDTFSDDINMGQPVWISPINPRIMILKRIEGYEHSIPDWSRMILNPDTNMPDCTTNEQAQLYFSKVNEIASMDESVYDDFASQVKLIDDKGFKIDSINPNNLIVNNQKGKEKINIIDFFKVKDREKHIYQNSSYDMLAIILDFTLFPEFYDKLEDSQKQKLIEDVDTISKKVNASAEKVGLDTKDEKFRTYIRSTCRWFPAFSIYQNDKTYFRYYDYRLEDFLKMIQNPYEWAKKRD